VSEAPQRILVTRLRFLGDVILSTPLLDALRARFPSAQIEYLVSEPFDELLLHHPSVDVIHSLPRQASLVDTLRMANRLRAPRIDWWFDLLTNPRSCMLALLARPRNSVGSDRGLRSRVYGHRRGRPGGNPSAIAHHLDKLAPLLGTSLEPTETRLSVTAKETRAARKRHGIVDGQSPVLLHAGNTWPDKAWPLEHWRALIASLQGAAVSPLWMLTPPGEADMATALAAESQVHLVEALPLREMLALLAQARLYIATLGLFGPTDPSIWFPYPDARRFQVLHEYNDAGACAQHVEGHVSRLAHLSPERVLDAALQLLRVEAGRDA
jgi:ADP-heptose:LPS heptosyltransferase